MKKIIPFLLICFLVSEGLNAQINLSPNQDSINLEQSADYKPVKGSREYYLQQSRTLNSLGAASLVVGGILIAAGFILHENGSDDPSGSWDVQSEAVKAGEANFCKGAGIALAAISIPLFIAGSEAKQKALSMSPTISFQQADVPTGKSSHSNKFPSIGIKINF